MLSFSGSSLSGRDATTQIIADNFGLSPLLAETKVGFNPRIDNHIIDFQLYVGLDEFFEGLYMQFNAPFVHSKWDLRAGSCSSTDNCDTGCSDSSSALPVPAITTEFTAGCMDLVSEGAITAAAKFDGTNGALGGDFLFGDMQEKWKYGRFDFCERKDNDFADFYANIGYNFYECPDYHFGAFIRVAAPTGTDLDQDCVVRDVFTPIIGQDHWRLGAGISAHAELYNCDDEHFINAYLEGYLVHMFEESQLRSFDFKNKGCMSRYMLLKEFNSDKTYKGLINAINFATRKVDVQVDVQGELLLEFVYNNDCGFSAGIGYNLYGRSEEDICAIGNAADSTIDARFFGIKGCAPINGDAWTHDNTNLTVDIANPHVLTSTQSAATITACGAVDSLVELKTNTQLYIDTCANTGTVAVGQTIASQTFANDSATIVGALAISGAGVVSGATSYTANPTQVTKADLDIKSGQVESQISHKIFGHLDYEWNDCDWAPYLRAGGSAEFGRCEDVGTMNSWSVFVGGGVAF